MLKIKNYALKETYNDEYVEYEFNFENDDDYYIADYDDNNDCKTDFE